MGEGFAFDNERPRHQVFLPGCEIASRPVNNAEFLQFVEAGGYIQPQWWPRAGTGAAQQLAHPWYWRRASQPGQTVAGWQEFSLHGALPLDGRRPVSHLSYYEADAYARWAGARLPTEAEWEVAWAKAMALQSWPQALHPTGTAGNGLGLGQVWEWTQSSYAPYRAFASPMARWASTTASSWSTSMCCVAARASRRSAIRVPATAISFQLRRVGR